MRKGNNNYWNNEYSHQYARAHYSKKCPKNLRELVVAEINAHNERYPLTIENICIKLSVLHKFVHQMFMQLQKEGVVRQARDTNGFGGSSYSGRTIFQKSEPKHKLPLSYINDAMHDGARHPKLYCRLKRVAA